MEERKNGRIELEERNSLSLPSFHASTLPVFFFLVFSVPVLTPIPIAGKDAT